MVLSIMNRYYFAKNNDTAAIISRRLGVDCNAILRLNQCVHAGLSKHAKLNRGCHLFIPGSDETMQGILEEKAKARGGWSKKSGDVRIATLLSTASAAVTTASSKAPSSASFAGSGSTAPAAGGGRRSGSDGSPGIFMYPDEGVAPSGPSSPITPAGSMQQVNTLPPHLVDSGVYGGASTLRQPSNNRSLSWTPTTVHAALILSADRADFRPLQSRIQKVRVTSDAMMLELGILIRAMYFHACSGPFQLPVNTSDLPQYKKIIAQPMDLSTIALNVSDRQYVGMHDMQMHVEQIVNNSAAFNGADSYITQFAQELVRVFKAHSAALSPSVLDVKFSQLSINDFQRFRKVVWSVQAHNDATVFNVPVDLVEVPAYADEIATPMDFGTIMKWLAWSGPEHTGKAPTHKKKYSILRELLHDVMLVFENCRDFNGKSHPLHSRCQTLEAHFTEHWNDAVAAMIAARSTPRHHHDAIEFQQQGASTIAATSCRATVGKAATSSTVTSSTLLAGNIGAVGDAEKNSEIIIPHVPHVDNVQQEVRMPPSSNNHKALQIRQQQIKGQIVLLMHSRIVYTGSEVQKYKYVTVRCNMKPRYPTRVLVTRGCRYGGTPPPPLPHPA